MFEELPRVLLWEDLGGRALIRTYLLCPLLGQLTGVIFVCFLHGEFLQDRIVLIDVEVSGQRGPDIRACSNKSNVADPSKVRTFFLFRHIFRWLLSTNLVLRQRHGSCGQM